jgi:hypothetical protein
MAVFDMDTHLRDEYFFDEIYRLEGEFAQYTPRRIGSGKLHFSKFENPLDPWGKEVGGRFNHELMYNPEKKWRGGRVAESQRGGYDMDYRLADNEREGIDYQFIFPTHISVAALPEGRLGSAVARAYNDWAAKLVKGKEERLWPVAMMPAGHPEGMVAELRRCVKELGCKAAHLVPYSLTRTLDDPAYEPFYAEAAKTGVPLFLHPASFGPLINNNSNFYSMHVLGRPFNCTAGLVALTVGGVFERHPDLNVVFFECGAEWILYWMHRMDDDYKNMQFGFAPHITRKPSEYVKRNCWVTCEADERLLAFALQEFNEDHVLMASDYPHFDSEFPGTVHELRERGDVSQKQKDKILTGNPQRLLRL